MVARNLTWRFAAWRGARTIHCGETVSTSPISRRYGTTVRSGLSFSTMYVASSTAIPLPTLRTEWTRSNGPG